MMGPIDPVAMTAAVAAARILGRATMLALFIDDGPGVDPVTTMICEVMGVQSDAVRYSPPTAERRSGVYSWDQDGDWKYVYVNLHVVLPASANDNQGAGT